ncbi:MAG: 50S ribosomal protein L21e [Candidatus Pacearchaeota archaeon]|jgi:large subunit ribosomal protein L21e
MVRRKPIRARGKIQLSKYFQQFKEGDNVTIIKEPSVSSSFPERIQGRTGTVEERRGRAYIIELMDHNMKKKFIIEPIHLKKIIKEKKSAK